MPKFKQTWDNITVSMFVACLAAIATAVVIGWWCVRRSPELPLLWLVALVAALIGWVAAMLATPYSDKEKQQFSDFGKVISGIITGFVLSKIGPLIDALVAIPAGGHAPITQPAVQEQLLIGLAGFLLSFLFVFGGRLYWWWDLEKP